MTTEQEKANITGLDNAADRKAAEYDLVTALLEAADFKESDDNITKVDIKRNGKFLFAVRVHPLSESDIRFARKKATVTMPNPNNKKLPPIEKEVDTAVFHSWLVYLATVEEDQENIWGNSAVMKKHSIMQAADSIDVLLRAGEKDRLVDVILDISGMNENGEEEVGTEDFR